MVSAAKRRKKENVSEPIPKITWKEIKKQKVLLFWAAVIVIYGIIFCYLPLGGWIMAFEDYKPKDGLLHSAFVGLDNFKQLFSDATFLRVIRNTLAMGVINLVATFIMAIVFAILLNEIRSRGGKKVVQTISYLPHFLSWIVVTGILHDALSGTGIINEILVNLNILDQPLNFFAHPKYFWPIVASQMCGRKRDGMLLFTCLPSLPLILLYMKQPVWTVQGAGQRLSMLHCPELNLPS